MPLVDWEQYASAFSSFEERTGTFTDVAKTVPTETDYEDIPAARGAVTNEMYAETDGAAIRPSAAYQIRKLNLAVEPQPGDRWTEGGTTYTVQVVRHDEAFWLIGVYDPRVDAGLGDECDVLQSTEGQTDAGTRLITQAPVLSDLLCRLQLRSSVPVEMHRKFGNLDTFDVYFDENHPILPDRHVLSFIHPITEDAVIADIVEVLNAQKIGDLMTVVAEVRP